MSMWICHWYVLCLLYRNSSFPYALFAIWRILLSLTTYYFQPSWFQITLFIKNRLKLPNIDCFCIFLKVKNLIFTENTNAMHWQFVCMIMGVWKFSPIEAIKDKLTCKQGNLNHQIFKEKQAEREKFTSKVNLVSQLVLLTVFFKRTTIIWSKKSFFLSSLFCSSIQASLELIFDCHQNHIYVVKEFQCHWNLKKNLPIKKML